MGALELGEQGPLTEQDWADVVAGEHDPFGEVGAGLAWQPKERHVTFRSDDGRLVAAAGALVASGRAGAGERFELVGIGSVIVTRSQRGRGLMRRAFEALLGLAAAMGPDRALLFCRPELVVLYERFGFERVEAPVWVDQPAGRIEMPMVAMWRRLREGPSWPRGRIDLDGLPF